MPSILYEYQSRRNNMSCSIVSKAALTSRSDKKVVCPASAELKMSEATAVAIVGGARANMK